MAVGSSHGIRWFRDVDEPGASKTGNRAELQEQQGPGKGCSNLRQKKTAEAVSNQTCALNSISGSSEDNLSARATASSFGI